MLVYKSLCWSAGTVSYPLQTADRQAGIWKLKKSIKNLCSFFRHAPCSSEAHRQYISVFVQPQRFLLTLGVAEAEEGDHLIRQGDAALHGNSLWDQCSVPGTQFPQEAVKSRLPVGHWQTNHSIKFLLHQRNGEHHVANFDRNDSLHSWMDLCIMRYLFNFSSCLFYILVPYFTFF